MKSGDTDYMLEDAIADARVVKKYLKKLTSKRRSGLVAKIMSRLQEEVPKFDAEKRLIAISDTFSELVEALENRLDKRD